MYFAENRNEESHRFKISASLSVAGKHCEHLKAKQ